MLKKRRGYQRYIVILSLNISVEGEAHPIEGVATSAIAMTESIILREILSISVSTNMSGKIVLRKIYQYLFELLLVICKYVPMLKNQQSL